MKSWLQLTLMVALAAGAAAEAADTQALKNEEMPIERTPSRTWIDRPWAMRYALKVSTDGNYQAAVRNDVRERQKTVPYGHGLMRWAGIFAPTHLIPTEWSYPITVVLIEFDRQGRVTTPHTHPVPLRGRLNQNIDIALSPGDNPKDPIFLLGAWFQGFGSGSEHWAPGLCAESEMKGPGDEKSTFYRYGQKFAEHWFVGGFGCREWTYQLYNDEHPYIDVTSYQPKPRKGSKEPQADHAILDFTGWARFDDKKPVIGLHHGTWYCLHDCPKGQAPGPIPNIRIWATQNGWKPPVPPKRMPIFPDRLVEPDSLAED
jgi:hypothetical protein